MAFSATTEYLPQSVLTGDADVELLQPFIDWGRSLSEGVSSIGDRINEFRQGLRAWWIRTQAWWEYGEKNPITLAAGWIEEKTKLSKWTIGGVNIGKWSEEDPIGFAAGVGASLGVLFTGGCLAFVAGKAAVGTAVALGAKAWGTAIGCAGSVVGAIKSMLGPLAGAVLGLISLGGICRWFVSGTQRVWQFNWNVTDQQIREQQSQRLKSLASRYGEAIGASIGTLCGFGLGRIAKANAPRLIAFNPNLLADLKELEARSWQEPGPLWEEAVDEISGAFKETLNAAAAIILLEGYMNARKLIKAASKFLQLQTIFPWLGNAIAKWGEPGSEPWSFALAQEKAIESIENETLRNFTEELVEAAQDMCAESTILVSGALG